MELKCSDVKKKYNRSNFELDIADFSLDQNEIVGILGPNGSGKTTFLKILADLIKLDSGILKFGNQIIQPKQLKKNIGYLPENFSFHPTLKINEVLELYFNLEKPTTLFSQSNITQQIIDLWGINYGDKKVTELSKGMHQTLGLSHILSLSKNIFILDEPFNGLDAVQKKRAFDIIMNIKKNTNSSLILTSHILSDIDKYCDNIYLIKDGKVINNISMKNLIEQYGSTENYYLNFFNIEE